MAIETSADNELRRYINQLLIKMHESQRELIQARYVGEGDNYQLRADLQADITAVYYTLKPYRNRAGNLWNTIELYTTQNGVVEGLEHISEWTIMNEEIEVEADDFSGTKETQTQPKILPKEVLIPTATAITEVADRIGFQAADPKQDDTDDTPF